LAQEKLAQLSGLLFKNGQVHTDDSPNEFEIDAKVLMDHEVSESGQLFPGNAGSQGLTIPTYPLGRLGQSLEIAYDSVLRHGAREEQIPTSRHVFLDPAYGFQNVFEIK